MIGDVLSLVTLGWSAGLASTTTWAAIRSSSPRPMRPTGARATIVVRPCAGDEPSLLRTLGSTEDAKAPPRIVRFAVAAADDPAAPVAQLACERLRAAGIDAQTVVTGAVGPNRKADQLARTLAREGSTGPVVIVADSDVDLAGVSLDDLLGVLSDARVGAAWAPPVEIAPTTLADRASAAILDGSLHAFAVLGALDPDGVVGKLLAVRRSALDEVGGFGALVGHLGEDMELGRRLRAAGWLTRMAPLTAPSRAQGRSWAQVIGRYKRWITVIRTQRPQLLLAYPALIAATPLVASLALLTVAVGGRHALAAASVAGGSRLFAACLARFRSGRPLRPLSLPIDIALADGLLLVAFAGALVSGRTVWRGVELRSDPRTGTLTGAAP